MRYFSIFLTAVLACGQATEDRTFRFHSPATDQDFQDLSVAALTMSGLKARTADVALRELSINGTSEQVRVTEWVVTELDRPAPATPAPPSSILTLSAEDQDNTIRVFYPAQISSNQDLMEVMTAIRTITDIRYAGMYTSHRAIVLRGNREQIDLAEWLLDEVNRDSPQQSSYAFPKSGPELARGENQVRVFRFTRAADVQQFNEAQTMIRTITDARRVYPYIGKRAIIIRATEEQIDMTRWILAQVDKELPFAGKATSSDYTMKAGDIVRLFFYSGGMTVPAFNERQTEMRLATGIRRVFPYASGRMIAARGTAAQIAQATVFAAQ
jgi:hypothetical protein